MKKRVLSVFMAVVMVVSLIPAVSVVEASGELGLGHLCKGYDALSGDSFQGPNLNKQNIFRSGAEEAFLPYVRLTPARNQ
ncbi:MAG: hypothetical protein FWH07_06170 [Oscillospiraceae bacterium]|nr:hypothetical protein [Oscillospiraceae bacterium]